MQNYSKKHQRAMKKLLLLLTIALSSCAEESDCQFTMPIMSDELSSDLVVMMDDRSVPYSINKQGRICVSADTVNGMPSLMDDFVEKHIPPKRSVSADHRLLALYKKSFSKNNIEYKEIIFDGHTFLVWPEKSAGGMPWSLIEEEKKKFFNGA